MGLLGLDPAYLATLIAGASALISVCAAVFARNSAAEARQANKIMIHEHQKSLFEEFRKVQDFLSLEGKSGSQEGFMLFAPHAKTAELYVGKKLVILINDFFSMCMNLKIIADQVKQLRYEQIQLDGKPSIFKTKLPENPELLKSIIVNLEKCELSLGEKHVVATSLGEKINDEFMRLLKLV
ncbi:hypothetical protein LZV00_02935 [Pseudomonas kielensis]|uniref:hypothetical protein n=1 Tax=Pseudomonas kielensis TaxID=2762577 RepID=UPI00223F9D50|nr:hypothetical protein [Pseudomonas kielensis]UZM14770.1 hypothetical protein LZV00_02935 [Pseudomonas kielensis]